MRAILLAAGYGTRMHPLTKKEPKALLSVKEKPLIEYILEKIDPIDEINEIFVVTNNKFYEQFVKWRKRLEYRVPPHIINDNTNDNQERLGSLGDLRFVLEKEQIKDDILLIHADNFFSFDLNALHSFFKEKNSVVVASYDCGDLTIAKGKTCLKIDENNKVVLFKEKDQQPSSTLCATGIFFVPHSKIGTIKDYLAEGHSPDRTGDFMEWLYKREDIYSYVYKGETDFCYDVGSFQTYMLVNGLQKNSLTKGK